MKKILVLLLLMVSTNVFAWSLFGPTNFDECLLENMKGVTSDQAAEAIEYACEVKFNTQEKQVECKLQEFTSSEMAKLQATGNVYNYGYFKGNVYNGSQKTIREILVIYKTSSKSESVKYLI